MIAIFVVYMIHTKPRIGIAIATFLVIIGNLSIVFFTHTNKSSPVLIDYQTTVT